ncbi:MAG: cbb3-type cytochrome c oxidase subunit I [Planctomycetota bacterium]
MVGIPMKDLDFVVRVQLRMALACLVLALLGGAASVLHYLPAASSWLNAHDLTMPRVRPVHTTFVTLWIYGAGVAMVYAWMARDGGGLRRGDLVRFKLHTLCWITAGLGIFVTALLGVSSGREYLEFHPAFAVPLLLGWVLFAWSFWKRAFVGFWSRPVYVYMWTVGTCLFVYAFVEAHVWLLPGVGDRPLRDLQLQWKSCGTLVGSFNFMVYGTIAYLRERISGETTPGQSRWAFALFGVGCLNSFTNYVHHTYHVPQDVTAKWIAFLVSMAEIVILWRVLGDVVASLRSEAPRHPALRFMASARNWNLVSLTLAIVISVPPWNAVIHGTHAVAAHAMGAEIGIDSMALFAAVSWLLLQRHPERQAALTVPGRLRALNFAAGALVGWLFVVGVANGWTRYHGEVPPQWVTSAFWVFPVLGGTFALLLLGLVARWWGLLRQEASSAATVEPAEAGAPAPAGSWMGEPARH